ncbi:MAG: hypothetical protein LBT90_04165 [Holosporaceae bacterium]|nr:hypothetical protein [Holosporaceae bacterium]
MPSKLFNTKVQIEAKTTTLSTDNTWVSEYSLWRELWASISIKYMSPCTTVYLFMIKWKRDFPANFRVKVSGKIFVPTQPPIQDFQSESIIFHAKLTG